MSLRQTAFATFASASLVAGCRGQSAVTERPPIVLISIDTLRADHLPAYGYDKVATPNLERLRRDAVLYENAYSQVPLTLPSHTSLMTGLLPFEHGVRDNIGYRLDPRRHPTLAAALRARGYATGAAVSAYVLRSGTGIGDGFELYDDAIVATGGTEALGRVRRPGAETLEKLLPWIGRVKARPFFLFFHVFEPHAPYEPKEPFRSRASLPYDGTIAESDAIVGRLLDELRRLSLYDRAAVVLLSDHGEGLGEHGEDEHGILLYRWALHVPLLVKLPRGERAGTSVSRPVALIDVFPTLARLAGASEPKGLRGRSLLEDQAPRRLYAETFYPRLHLGWSELRGLLDGRWQYIEGRERELYDIATDPDERLNLLAGHAEVARSREKELGAIPVRLEGPKVASNEETEKLAALGYLGGAVETSGPRPDPRASIHVLAEAKAAFRLGAGGHEEQAVAALRRILGEFPDFFDARFELAQLLVRLGRYAEAYGELHSALRSSPALSGVIALHLGRVALKLGRRDEAESHARLALASDPAQAHELLARIALSRDDLVAAEREARAVRGDAAAELAATVVRAEVLIRQGRFGEALAAVEAAERGAVAASVPDLEFMRGDALARLGRYAEARAAFEQEVGRFPANSQAWARLAILGGVEGRRVSDVDRLLEKMVAANPTSDTRELAARTLESMGDRVGAARWRRRTNLTR